MPTRRIAQIVPMPHHAFDAHSGAHMLRAAPEQISPFIGIDSYTMPQPFFGPHPHAGMSAVTLMLPEADGGFINRDSLGDQILADRGYCRHRARRILSGEHRGYRHHGVASQGWPPPAASR